MKENSQTTTEREKLLVVFQTNSEPIQWTEKDFVVLGQIISAGKTMRTSRAD